VRTTKHFVAEQVRRQQETPQVGRVLLLFVDETVADATPFGDVGVRGAVERKTGLRIFTSWRPLDCAVAAILLWPRHPASKMNTYPAC